MDCPRCEFNMFYTGEHHPTTTPQRFYACQNKHVYLLYGQSDEAVDWGDCSISRAWRQAVTDDTVHEWEMVGKGY